MPQLGETVTEGTITRWLKAVGDHVGPDESLFEVSTDKVDTEVPVLVPGYLREVLVPEGDTVAIGVAVAVMTVTADEPYTVDGVVPAGAAGPSAATQEASIVGSPVVIPPPSGPPRHDDRATTPDGVDAGARSSSTVLTPAVRRMLDEHRLSADDVSGSGRHGRITRADVLAAAAFRSARTSPSTAPPFLNIVAAGTRAPTAPASAAPAVERGPDDDVVEFTKARRATAEHMVRSLRTSAHTLVGTQVDYRNVDSARSAATGTRLSYLPFVARAVIDALRAFPYLNASVGDDELIVHRRIHLGVAVDVDNEALVVPVIHDADALRIAALSDAVAALAARARAKRLGADDLAGGTFTVTNVGRYGTVVTAPVINQPQVAILSTDGVRMTPVAVPTGDGGWAVAVHPVGNLSLTFDHRAVDGAYAAAFLARVRELLETRDWSAELSADTILADPGGGATS